MGGGGEGSPALRLLSSGGDGGVGEQMEEEVVVGVGGEGAFFCIIRPDIPPPLPLFVSVCFCVFLFVFVCFVCFCLLLFVSQFFLLFVFLFLFYIFVRLCFVIVVLCLRFCPLLFCVVCFLFVHGRGPRSLLAPGPMMSHAWRQRTGPGRRPKQIYNNNIYKQYIYVYIYIAIYIYII